MKAITLKKVLILLFLLVFCMNLFNLPDYSPNAFAASKPLPSLLTREGDWHMLQTYGGHAPNPNARGIALDEAVALPLANTNPWNPLGPAPLNADPAKPGYGNASGRITAIAVNPTNSNELWVGGADGGVWHSTTAGASWIPLTDTQASLSIGSIAVDPNAPATVYVGTGEANDTPDEYPGIGILKSTDGGQTWTTEGNTQFAGLGIGKIVVSSINSQVILAAVSFTQGTPKKQLSNRGIWRSGDGGVTWTQVLSNVKKSGPSDGTDIVIDPAVPGIIYAGLANSSAAGIYKSTDSGQTWTLLSSGVPIGKSITRISLGISKDGVILSALFVSHQFIMNNALYLSHDLGVTWITQDVSQLNGDAQWYYDITTAFDPSDGTDQTIYIGGVNLWKTSDGGVTWNNVLPDPGVHVDQHALTFFNASSSSFYLGNDGGVWSGTVNGGQLTFTNLNAGGLNITQFYSGTISTADPQQCNCASVYAGAQDNGIDQYPPGQSGLGQWNEVQGGDGGITIADYTNKSIIYATSPFVDDGISKSSDGGQTWRQVINGINTQEPMNFYMPLAMSPLYHTELFTGTDHVYSTVNSANTWTPISGTLDPGSKLRALSAIAISSTDDRTIYAGDDSGKVFVTTTGGCGDNSCWTQTTAPGNTIVTSIAVDFMNPDIVYIGYPGYNTSKGHHVYKSTDAGKTWVDISTKLPNVPVLSLAINPVDGNIFAGTDIGVFEGSNTGGGWARVGTGLPDVAVDQVFTDPSGTTLYAATHGRGMWNIPISQPASWHASNGANVQNAANSLTAVAATSPKNAFAVGFASPSGGQPDITLTEQWNGKSWTVVPSPTVNGDSSDLTGITAIPKTGEYWTIGSYQASNRALPFAMHWTGTQWSLTLLPDDGSQADYMTGVSATSPSDVWAVGGGSENTITEHYDGSQWQLVQNVVPGDLSAVAAIAPNDVWVVGRGPIGMGNPATTTLAEHFDGTSWTTFPTPNPGTFTNYFTAITAVSSNNIWAVGGYTNGDGLTYPLAAHWDGTNWTQVSLPSPGQLTYVEGITRVPGTNQVWISGTYQPDPSASAFPFAEQFDGTNWNLQLLPTKGVGDNLTEITATSETNIWAVGEYIGNSGDLSLIEQFH